MKAVKAGIVGVGRMGEYHVGVLAEMQDVEIVGVADVDEARARAISQKYDVPFFTRYADLIGKVDVVVIAVPTSMHYSVTKDFLEGGVHVLLEKPCANNMDDARDMFNLAERKGLTLHTGHVERFNGAVQELHKIVKEPLFVEAKRTSPFTPRIKDDGVVMDVMIHDIDIVLNLVQSRVKRKSVAGISVFTDKDDVVTAQLQFENSCIANLLASRASQNKERTLAVSQKDSYVLLDYTEQEIYVHRQSSSENQLSRGTLRYKQASMVERIFVHKDNPLKLELAHFLDCVRNGSPRKIAVNNELYSLEIALEILDQFHRQNEKLLEKVKAH